MSTKFNDFVREVEDKSTAEERSELDAARARFKIGSRVLQHRLAVGLTQQQLASASGIAQADISRIERGQSNPTTETLEALAGPLGVTLDLVPAGPHPHRSTGGHAVIATDDPIPPHSVAKTAPRLSKSRRYIPST